MEMNFEDLLYDNGLQPISGRVKKEGSNESYPGMEDLMERVTKKKGERIQGTNIFCLNGRKVAIHYNSAGNAFSRVGDDFGEGVVIGIVKCSEERFKMMPVNASDGRMMADRFLNGQEADKEYEVKKQWSIEKEVVANLPERTVEGINDEIMKLLEGRL